MADPQTAYGTKTDSGKVMRNAKDVMAAAPATVPADTPIIELFTPCSTSGTAVAVTDDEGELIGVVPRARLLAVLGEPMTPTAPPAVPAQPAPALATPATPAGKAVASA
jgi:glycine betaine/proline transport system ATP-binding protein